MADSQIECKVHGWQDSTYVCRHILESLRDREARGFWFDTREESARPDAWCNECNSHLVAHGGSWTDETQVPIAVLCGKCYDEAKSLNHAQSK